MSLDYDFQDFIETEHLPVTFKITSGFYSDKYDFAAGEVYTAESVDYKDINLQYRNRITGKVETKKIRPDFILKFIVKRYDPDRSNDLYRTVSDLRYVCPFIVQCGLNYADHNNPQNNFAKGQLLRLMRFVNKEGDIRLECHSAKRSSFIYLPLNCVGNFRAIYNKEQYTTADLIGIFKRRCKVVLRISDHPVNTIHSASLPCSKESDIILLPTRYDVIIARDNSPGITEHVDIDIPISVSPRAFDYTSPLQVYYDFEKFVDANAYLMPFVIKVFDWSEAMNVFELHGIRPGVRLHIFSLQQNRKILACSEDSYFIIPVSNHIRFSKCPKLVTNVDALHKLAPCSVRVVSSASPRYDRYLKKKFTIGQVVKVPKSPRVVKSFDGNEEETVPVEIFDGKSNSFTRVYLPLFLDYHFEEQINNDVLTAANAAEVTLPLKVKPLIPDDGSSKTYESFTVDDVITLTCCFDEESVLACTDANPAESFYLPIRNGLKIGLDKRKPVLKNIPELSEAGHCVHTISEAVFNEFRQLGNVYESAYAKVPPLRSDATKPKESVKLATRRKPPPPPQLTNLGYTDGEGAQAVSPFGEGKVKSPSPFAASPSSSEHNSGKSPRKTAVVSPTQKSSMISKVLKMSPFTKKGPKETYENTSLLNVFKFKSPSFKVPDDGDLNHLSVNEMAKFMEAMGMSTESCKAVYEHGIDGQQFGLMSDDDLNYLNMGLPVIKSFRDKTLKTRRAATLPAKQKK